MSQRKKPGRQQQAVPRPRVLSQDEFNDIYKALRSKQLTQIQAWQMWHFLTLALNVQTSLVSLLAQQSSMEEARGVLKELYATHTKSFNDAMEAASEMPEAVRPS